MELTLTGMSFVAKFMMLAWLLGFWFACGLWVFCKAFRWAPVNITINQSADEV